MKVTFSTAVSLTSTRKTMRWSKWIFSLQFNYKNANSVSVVHFTVPKEPPEGTRLQIQTHFCSWADQEILFHQVRTGTCPKINGPFASMQLKPRKLLKTFLKCNDGEIMPLKKYFFFVICYSLIKRRKPEQWVLNWIPIMLQARRLSKQKKLLIPCLAL